MRKVQRGWLARETRLTKSYDLSTMLEHQPA